MSDVVPLHKAEAGRENTTTNVNDVFTRFIMIARELDYALRRILQTEESIDQTFDSLLIKMRPTCVKRDGVKVCYISVKASWSDSSTFLEYYIDVEQDTNTDRGYVFATSTGLWHTFDMLSHLLMNLLDRYYPPRSTLVTVSVSPNMMKMLREDLVGIACTISCMTMQAIRGLNGKGCIATADEAIFTASDKVIYMKITATRQPYMIIDMAILPRGVIVSINMHIDMLTMGTYMDMTMYYRSNTPTKPAEFFRPSPQATVFFTEKIGHDLNKLIQVLKTRGIKPDKRLILRMLTHLLAYRNNAIDKSPCYIVDENLVKECEEKCLQNMIKRRYDLQRVS